MTARKSVDYWTLGLGLENESPQIELFQSEPSSSHQSNPILTLFTYILYASTMYKHIFGLILVTHDDLGVQLDHNYQFSII